MVPSRRCGAPPARCWLGVPAAELDAVAGRMGRVVVVPMAGGRHREVVLAVGNVLSGLGVDLSPGLRAQLARAREEARSA